MKRTLQKLRIFVASPSDMSAERAQVEKVATMLKPLADEVGLTIDVVDWRAAVPDMGCPEQVILDQLKPTSWDVFIGILWHRFGTPPGGKDPQTKKEYLSGTEEEFKIAYRLWKLCRNPRIMIYRCKRKVSLDMIDFEQAQRVNEFFAQFNAVKGEHPGLYREFDTTEEFDRLLFGDLQKILLDYGKHIEGRTIPPERVQALAPRIPNNLPRRVAFFGREKEMAKVLSTLNPHDRGWGIVIDGIGGIGKTALAIEAAYRAQESKMFDAFIFVSAKNMYLAPEGIRKQSPAACTFGDFVNETARVLGEPAIAQLADADKKRALLDALRRTRALLIYDNLESLTKEEQEVLSDFMRFLPQNSKAIFTSRRRGGEGALWLRLEKLELDAALQMIAEEAKKDARLAEKLRCAEARWHELYDETKGSPLALVHILGLMRVRTTLTFDGALELLRSNRDPDLQRFIFEEARKELGTSEIAALRALSFFVPSAPFEALTEVAKISRNVLEAALDRLDALSLLDKPESTERYALHPLTRTFVRNELLADAQIVHEIGRRFAEYWVNYAKRYGGSRKDYKTYDRLEAEWANLEATAEELWQTAAVQNDNVGNKDAARMLSDLAYALWHFLWFGGRWEEMVLLSTRSYEAMHALKDWSNAGWHADSVAAVHYCRANTDEAAHWTDRASEAWEHAGSKYEQAIAMRMRGLVAKQRKDYDTAERLLQNALKVYRNMENDEAVAIVLNSLGGVKRNRKQYDAAERYYREALALAEKIDDKEGQATYMDSLGSLSLDLERWAEVHEWSEKALMLAKEIGRQDLISEAQYCLSRMHEAEGRPDIARPLAQEALAICERLQHEDLAEVRELVERLMRSYPHP